MAAADVKNWVETSMDNASYVETSAKYDVNVGELFSQLLLRTYGKGNEGSSGKVGFKTSSYFQNETKFLSDIHNSEFNFPYVLTLLCRIFYTPRRNCI